MTEPNKGAGQRVCVCGQREGLHRWLTQWCPNPAWKPCSSKNEWLPLNSFQDRGDRVSA